MHATVDSCESFESAKGYLLYVFYIQVEEMLGKKNARHAHACNVFSKANRAASVKSLLVHPHKTGLERASMKSLGQ